MAWIKISSLWRLKVTLSVDQIRDFHPESSALNFSDAISKCKETKSSMDSFRTA